MKQIPLITIQRKLNFWKKRLGLEDWDISIAYRSRYTIGQSFLAVVDGVDCENMRASIKINKDYHTIASEEDSIDITLIHELVHIIFHEYRERLPNSILRRKDMKELEEYICDYFAEVFVNNLRRERAKK